MSDLVVEEDRPEIEMTDEDRVRYLFRAHKDKRGWSVTCPECETVLHAGQKRTVLAVAKKHALEAEMVVVDVVFPK